jgi:hypothetical protein
VEVGLEVAGVLPGWVCLGICPVAWLTGRRETITLDLLAAHGKQISQMQYHKRFTITAHGQCRGREKPGGGKDEPQWPGMHNQFPKLALQITIKHLSGHFPFPTDYSSTIGTDFITKTRGEEKEVCIGV